MNQLVRSERRLDAPATGTAILLALVVHDYELALKDVDFFRLLELPRHLGERATAARAHLVGFIECVHAFYVCQFRLFARPVAKLWLLLLVGLLRCWTLHSCVFTTLVACLASCSRGSPYDRLCAIYEEVGKEPLTPERAAIPFQRAQKEIPELSSDLALLANVSLAERYELLKTMAREKAGQPNWQCEAIRQWNPPP